MVKAAEWANFVHSLIIVAWRKDELLADGGVDGANKDRRELSHQVWLPRPPPPSRPSCPLPAQHTRHHVQGLGIEEQGFGFEVEV